jgi:opacity protein-like surface antigen
MPSLYLSILKASGLYLAMLAAAGEYRWTQQTQPWLPAFELAVRYQYLFPQGISGNVTQYALPQYTAYTYNWRTSANVVSAFTKLDLVQYKQAMVYFDFGLGAAFVNAQHYQESALPNVFPRVSPGYTNNTSTQFSYNVGAGIDLSIFPQLIFSVGYDYQSIGGVVSGNGQSTWSGTALNLGTYGINTALISLTYLFDNPFTPHAVYK